MNPTLLNKEVAADLGLSESGVSRLRSGSRSPSLSVMQQIEAVYGWGMQDQSDARKAGHWLESFENALAEYAADPRVPEDATA